MKKTINSKNYNKWKKIDIIVVLIICVLSFLFTFLSGTVEEELSFSSIPKDNLIYMIVLVICSIPSLLSLLAFYFGIRYTIKKVEKKNLTYNASKDIMYYREYLDNLTPFEVSILVNLKLEYKKDIIATILWYKNKGYLDIKNEQIIFNNNIDLTEKDKYFFSFLKTKDLKYLDIYKNITYEELKEKKYIIENNINIVHFFIKNILIIIGFFIFMMGLILINSFIIKNFVMQKIIDIVLIIIILIILYKKSFLLVKVYLNKRNKYQRTALGEEKTTYIHALQNFIHDFSNLKDADKKEIVLWNDFLVYAIILEENNKIVDDIIKLLNDDNDFKSILNLFNTFTIF